MLEYISNFTSLMRYKGLKYWPYFCLQSTNYIEKCLAEKYVRHRLGKSKRSWWDCKQKQWLSRSSRSKVFYKKDVLRNFPKSRKEHLHQILFLIEPDSVDLQLHLNGDFSTVIFVSFAKFVGHLFCRTTRRRLLLIIAAWIVVRRNWKTKL